MHPGRSQAGRQLSLCAWVSSGSDRAPTFPPFDIAHSLIPYPRAFFASALRSSWAFLAPFSTPFDEAMPSEFPLGLPGHKSPAERTSPTATDALKAIPRVKPDVLFVDVCLPMLDGPSLLRLLRSRGIVTGAVLFTGLAGVAQIREAMSAEPAGFVSKIDDLDCWRKALESKAAVNIRRALRRHGINCPTKASRR